MISREIYADALSRESSWFRERIESLRERNKRLTKNKPLSIDLREEVEPWVFQSFVHWIYRHPKDANREIRIGLDKVDMCLGLIKIWVFGYRFGARNFGNGAAHRVGLLQRRASTSPTPFISVAAVQYLWKHSGPHSVLSRALVSDFDLSAECDIDLEAYPKGFICAAYKKRLDDAREFDQVRARDRSATPRAELP